MGRRAKNKQPAPTPFSDPDVLPPKRPKRKAEADVEEKPAVSARPAKKLKDSASSKSKPSKKAKSAKAAEEEDWGGVDEDDLQTQTKYVMDTNAVINGTYLSCRLLFNDSDEEGPEGAFTGDLNDLDLDDEFSYVQAIMPYELSPLTSYDSEMEEEDDDEPAVAQDFDFDTDEEDDEPAAPLVKLKSKKSKQADRPAKIIPTLSDQSSDDEDGEEELNFANMEAKSKALDAQAAEEAELDLAEAQAAAEEEAEDEDMLDGEEGEDVFHLPTAEQREQESKTGGPDIHVVQRRIREIIRVLGKFSKKAEKGRYGISLTNTVSIYANALFVRSRSEYIDQLVKDIASYYGYNEFLAEKLLMLFPVEEVRLCWASFEKSTDMSVQAIEFFEANEVSRPVTIRTNTLRTRRRDLAQTLVNRGVTLEPIGKWTNVGLQVFESAVPIGATPEYLAGHYMLQAASSFLPVISLSPQPNERVLDMASAPGGKTTHMAALMQNTGVVFANDTNKARTKSLTANVHRLGCKNVVVCSYDGREFPKVIGGFDRVLLDAPCSGTGVISKDSSVKINKVSH